MAEPISIDPIVLRRDTAATCERAWLALTDPSEVARWFTEATPVGPTGSPYRLDFGDSAVTGTVVALEPERELSYTWAWEGEDQRQETRVTWLVEPVGTGSRITLRHDGWAEAGADEAARNDHAGYWEGYLDDLVDLLESGPG